MKESYDEKLASLREQVCALMSPKRFRHTLAVEDMVARLCELFCPEYTDLMRGAALLHDITKELSTEEQIKLCKLYGLEVTPMDRLAHKTFHARTAAEKIKAEYPDFAHPIIVNAVRWHTTGHSGMTLTEKLLYLADYIDESRNFESCVILRRYFWGADPASMNAEQRLALLRDTLILSYDMTLRDLIEDGLPFGSDTVQARSELLLERATAQKN